MKRGETVQIAKTQTALFVGTTANGTDCYCYQASQFGAMCARFDAAQARRADKAAVREEASRVKVTFTRAQFQMAWVIFGCGHEEHGVTMKGRTMTATRAQFAALEEIASDTDEDDLIDHNRDMSSAQYDFALRNIRKCLDNISAKAGAAQAARRALGLLDINGRGA